MLRLHSMKSQLLLVFILGARTDPLMNNRYVPGLSDICMLYIGNIHEGSRVRTHRNNPGDTGLYLFFEG